MAKAIMIQGTMSNAGKSLLAAGLCRIFKQDGYRVAPFKSQNMALNSFITEDGLEMGRAQVMQAEAAGIKPSVLMNPILLKPTNDVGSQVIVNGEVLGTMSARDYFAYKKQLIPKVMEAYHKLEKDYDIIVIEGAGSPAEINLKEDIVNMGMAKQAKAPVLLVGDIDRGGVFAQLIGTVMLLEEDEQKMVKGMIINKFRGDKTILDPGVVSLEEKTGIPVVGVAPYMELEVEDEDSLTERFSGNQEIGAIDIAVIRVPRISNFTDFNALEMISGVSLRYVKSVSELKNPDMIILPGTKNTMEDLLWLRQSGLEAAILKKAAEGKIIFGVCGGYQMLGEKLSDPDGVEAGGEVKGMGLLPMETVFQNSKTRTRVSGTFPKVDGALSALTGIKLEGYEIHMGESVLLEGAQPFTEITDHVQNTTKKDGAYSGNVYGSYVHGIFDKEEVAKSVVKAIGERKGLDVSQMTGMDFAAFKETQYDKLADGLREHLDMKKIYEILEAGLNKKRGRGQMKVELENVKPKEIETRSFEIITEELGDKKLVPGTECIVKRCIHTSADFDYADNLCFSPNAVEKAIEAIKNGACIVTDTQMAKAGINKKALAKYGGEVYCFMSDEDVAKKAKELGTTRATASMDKAAELGKPLIFAIGNAPTALVRLYELINEKKISPYLIIGVPVGFVNVVQSKEMIMDTEVPYIVARGRKGGSNIAACICNALLYMIDNERDYWK